MFVYFFQEEIYIIFQVLDKDKLKIVTVHMNDQIYKFDNIPYHYVFVFLVMLEIEIWTQRFHINVLYQIIQKNAY